MHLRGPFSSYRSYLTGMQTDAAQFTGTEIMGWTDSASLPMLPAEGSLEVFVQLRRAPRLDTDKGPSWRARPHRELDATNDKKHMDVESAKRPEGFWPVYKGESLTLWEPDTGTYYAWAAPKVLLPVLYEKRMRSGRNG